MPLKRMQVLFALWILNTPDLRSQLWCMWCHQVVPVVPLSSSFGGRSSDTQNSNGGDPGFCGDGDGDGDEMEGVVAGLKNDV